jgi:small subunit ribosomal protein S4
MKVGPKFKICRRLGSCVFTKCQTTKFSISGSAAKGAGRPRMRRPRALSEYGRQLIEKQKARYTYCLKERQLAGYVGKVRRGARGNPTARLFQLLESRLDNVVFRLGLANSRLFARQIVTHGHITLNGRRVNIPSAAVKVGDSIGIRPQSRAGGMFENLEEKLKNYVPPAWLLWDEQAQAGKVVAEPVIGEAEADINFGAILEFYSRV